MKKCKDCGREGWGFLSVLNKDGYCQRCATIHNGEKVKKLQEQLEEANEVIKDYDGFTAEITEDGKYAFKIANSARLYLEKWGVK